MKRIWVSLVAAALLSLVAIMPAAAQDTVTINMQEVDGSGQSGSADITSDGDQVVVSIEIEPGPDGEPQPVHIHDGSCQELGGVAYPLEDVVDGVSESTADVSLLDLIRGEYAINVHLSEDEMNVNVACGTLPYIPGSDADEDAAEEEDDAEATDDDEATVDDDEDAVIDDDDEAVDEDEDDAVAGEEDDAMADEEDAADDDPEDLVPATGGSGMNGESAAILMTLFGGAALGAGLLARRRLSIQS